MTFGVSGGNGNIPTPSALYPAKVFLHTPHPEEFLANGYNRIRLQKRINGVWTDIPDTELEPLEIEPGRYNYYFIDPTAEATDYFRAVIYDSTGVEADIPQPPSPAIDTSYEMVMTIDELKQFYLWGQDPAFISDIGQFQPDAFFAHNIRYGIAKVERKLSINLLPKLIADEGHDWMRNGGQQDNLQFWLDEFPVRSLESVTLNIPGRSAADPFVFPPSWCRLDKKSGRLALVPDTIAPGVGGMSFDSLAQWKHLPDAFKFRYFAGVDLNADWTLPIELKEAVGKEAATGPLNVGGDLVGGAGLAGSSISMDGLSQSITTTNSSTNAGFGARLIQYEKELRETYKTLLPHYKGIRFRVG